jgi:DNA-binding GntR family transcriptional regulator
LKRKIEGASPTRGVAAYEEHLQILAAIRGGDVLQARELAGLHVRNARAAVLTQLHERQTLLEV